MVLQHSELSLNKDIHGVWGFSSQLTAVLLAGDLLWQHTCVVNLPVPLCVDEASVDTLFNMLPC